MLNSIGFCFFYCFQPNATPFEVTDIVRAVTGWDTTLYELMNGGRRILTMARIYNLREGFTAHDDWLPPRFFKPTTSGALKETKVDPEKLRQAIQIYYELMGWHKETGVPSTTTLGQLDIDWTSEYLAS
jgi:aldehyde:ferredoxin oxidoreductase